MKREGRDDAGGQTCVWFGGGERTAAGGSLAVWKSFFLGFSCESFLFFSVFFTCLLLYSLPPFLFDGVPYIYWWGLIFRIIA